MIINNNSKSTINNNKKTVYATTRCLLNSFILLLMSLIALMSSPCCSTSSTANTIYNTKSIIKHYNGNYNRPHHNQQHRKQQLQQHQQRVLLISFDGFRYDYIEAYNLKHMADFYRDGVKAAYLNTQFNSHTVPNHWSMVTGSFIESHGMIANTFYDPLLKESFNMHKSDLKWWNASEPIWLTASKQSIRTAVNSWPGCSVQFDENESVLANYRYIQLDNYANLQKKIDLTLKWMINDDIQFSVIYENQPDAISHKYGINSPEFNVTLKQIDQNFGYLISKLKLCNLYNSDNFNLLVVSDHGMVNVKKNLFINDYFNESDAHIWSFSSTMIHLKPLIDRNELLAKLNKMPHVSVLLKEKLAQRLNYKNNHRIGDIILTADEGVAFISVNKGPLKITQNGQTIMLDLTYEQKKKLFNLSADKATHGYDGGTHASMRGLFMAHGAMFKRQHNSLSSLENVDIYPMLCTILSIECEQRNGSFDRIKEFLKHEYRLQWAPDKQRIISVKSAAPASMTITTLFSRSGVVVVVFFYLFIATAAHC